STTVHHSVPPQSHPLFVPPPPTAIYSLSLHDALPIYRVHMVADRDRHLPALAIIVALQRMVGVVLDRPAQAGRRIKNHPDHPLQDRKSTRLNSSHGSISYAVFCLKKKKKNKKH